MKYIFYVSVKINCIKHIPTDKLIVSNNFFKTSSYNFGQFSEKKGFIKFLQT